eukprot:6463091-Prymnesium_polylepis.1
MLAGGSGPGFAGWLAHWAVSNCYLPVSCHLRDETREGLRAIALDQSRRVLRHVPDGRWPMLSPEA